MNPFNNIEEAISSINNELENKEHYECILRLKLNQKKAFENKLIELNEKKLAAGDATEYKQDCEHIIEEIATTDKVIAQYKDYLRKTSMYEEILSDIQRGKLAMTRLSLLENDEQLASLDANVYALQEKKTNIENIIKEGKEIISITNNIEDKFDDLLDISRLDFWESGLRLDDAKYVKVEKIQNSLETLKNKLTRFNIILDVYGLKTDENQELNISNSMQLLDYLFDGIIFRRLVHNKIVDAKNKICALSKDIENIIYSFKKEEKSIDSRINKIQETINDILSNSVL